MTKQSTYSFTLYNSTNMTNMLSDAKNLKDKLFADKLKSLNIQENYIYTPDVAVDELGLELELVHRLIEDYVIQIVKNNMTFLQHLEHLKSKKQANQIMDYTPLRELAHKNLGVARNLRIADAEKLLYRIMKENDLDFIFLCLEALLACVTILRPKEAFDTLRLIKVKNSL